MMTDSKKSRGLGRILSLPVSGINKGRGVRGDILICAGILTGCSLVGLLFYFLGLSEANIITVYILGILLISSITAKGVYGIISSVVGVFLFNCLYAEPRFTLFVYDPQYTLTTIIMLVASLITSYVMSLFRYQLDREILETRRSELLRETGHGLQQSQDADGILAVAAKQMNRIFERTSLLLTVSGGRSSPLVIVSGENGFDFQPDAWGLTEDAWKRLLDKNSEKENPFVCALKGKKAVFFKMSTKDSIFAVAGVLMNADEDISDSEHRLTLEVLDEIAGFFEKHNLRVFNERIAREAETERLRTSILRTISHDLRTPLTSISGNADMLLSSGKQLGDELSRQLYRSIYDDSKWLIGLVENLLFISRMENGEMPVQTEPEVIQDVVREAMNYMGKHTRAHDVSVELPDELLMVRVDARLFVQVIVNIVDNAVKYTPKGSRITVKAARRGERIVVEVADTGLGISREDKEKVFEMFYTANNGTGDSRRGIGLGLPLCKAIMLAHGGGIEISDNAPGGVVVGLSLQLEDVCFES